MDGERPPLAAGATVLVGRADADLARARGERGRDAGTGRVVVGAVAVEVPRVREAAPGTTRRQHHHGSRTRGARDGADRRRRTPRLTGRRGRVAAGIRVARRGRGRNRYDRGHHQEHGRAARDGHPLVTVSESVAFRTVPREPNGSGGALAKFYVRELCEGTPSAHGCVVDSVNVIVLV